MGESWQYMEIICNTQYGNYMIDIMIDNSLNLIFEQIRAYI